MKVQELRLISTVLDEQSWDLLNDNDILDSDFSSPEGKEALNFVRKYYLDTKEFPPKDLVVTEANLVEFPQKVERSYVVKNFKDFLIGHRAKDIITRAAEQINKYNNTQQALSILAEAAFVKRNSKLISFLGSGEERLKDIKDANVGGIKGIKTPWETLNKAIVVWEDATFNTLAGISSTGKSWLACYIAQYAAFELGKKVLLVSMENPTESMLRRIDAIKYKIPFSDRRSGNVDFRLYSEYKKAVKHDMEFPGNGDIWIADTNSVSTVSDITAILANKEIDFVIIDGAYIVKPTKSGKDDYNNSENLIKDFHEAATSSDIPWLGILQLNPDAEDIKDSKNRGFKTRGNKSWYMYSSTLVTLTGNAEDRALRRVKLGISKVREVGDIDEITDEFHIHQDKVNMNFSEIEEEYVNPDILSATM